MSSHSYATLIQTMCEGFFFFLIPALCFEVYTLGGGGVKINLYLSTFYFWYFSICLLTSLAYRILPTWYSTFFFFLYVCKTDMWAYKLLNFQCNGSGLTVFGTIENDFPLTFNVTRFHCFWLKLCLLYSQFYP